MTVAVAHLLAIYAVVAAPWLGHLLYQKALRGIRAGNALAKVRLYRQVIAEQIVTTAFALWLCFPGAIPFVRLGLGAPRSWWLSAGLAITLGGLLVWSGVRLQPKARKIREKMKGRLDALLPDTPQEQHWLAAVSVGAGVNEELVFRGFLFYYLALWFPRIHGLECALLTSLIFGIGHLYQGWKGILSTGLVGLVLAGLYLLTGNLLVPIVVHASMDLRAAMIFWKGNDQQATAAAAD
jgi:uncharacterized protein